MEARAVFLLCRPLNLLGIGLAVATSIRLVGGTWVFGRADVAVMAGWVLLAAGGYVIDDVRDRESDARIRPIRPIASGLVSWELGLRFGTGLLVAGAAVLALGYAGLWAVGGAAALVLHAYGRDLKRASGLAANVMVSVLLALAVMSGGFRSGQWRAVAVPGLMMFCSNFGREIVMDIADLNDDRRLGYRTIPLIHGVRVGRRLAGVFLSLGGCSGYLFAATGLVWSVGFAIGLTVVNLGLATAVSLPLISGRADPRRLVNSIKVAMIAYLLLIALQLR
jgi:4-hydroxybenzoate polyprenyltransferase